MNTKTKNDILLEKAINRVNTLFQEFEKMYKGLQDDFEKKTDEIIESYFSRDWIELKELTREHEYIQAKLATMRDVNGMIHLTKIKTESLRLDIQLND